MLQNHQVRLVEASELPLGTEWMLVEADGRMCVFITAAALRPDAMEEMWAAYRLLLNKAIAPPVPPRPRVVSLLARAS